MPLPDSDTFTIDDIYNLPEGQRAELIDGRIYYMAPPSRRHQKIISFLHLEIADYIRSNGGPCEVYPAPFAVYLSENSDTYVEPDISVICDRMKLDDRGCKGAPDWVIEVVSPASRQMDYFTKLFKYRSAGVREYWLVDQQKDRITVWNFEKDYNKEYSFADSIEAGIYPGFYIDFAGLDLS